MYNLPKVNVNEIKNKTHKTLKSIIFWRVLLIIIAGCIMGFSIGIVALHYFPSQTQAFLKYFEMPVPELQNDNQPISNIYTSDIAYEQEIINAAKNVSPSVVSIVISKNLPVYEQEWINPFGDSNGVFDLQIPQYVQKGTKYQEVGEGSGFIVSEDGLVLTNKHVVSDNKADYTVLTNDGKKYSTKVLALDPVQDLAVIKIQLGKSDNPDTKFKPVKLGDSSGIQLGQTAVAIGNALGEFRNTVSVGIVSGLGRTILASDQTGSVSETLEDIIQTDAAINSGNSGGPLLNLKGEVIGINTAIASGAQSIGFALPINLAKKDISQVKATNKIVYPFLGVRYVLIDDIVKEKYKLSVDYGALVLKGNDGESAVTKGSPAEKAGIKEKDIILELDGEKVTTNNSMAKMIQKHNIGDKVTLKILRNNKEQSMEIILSERPS